MNRYLLRVVLVVGSTISCSMGSYNWSHSLVARIARMERSHFRNSSELVPLNFGKEFMEGGLSFLSISYWRICSSVGSVGVRGERGSM